MNRKVTQVLLSISLATFISCAPSIKSTLERNKRSFYPKAAHKLLSHLWVPGRHKHDQQGFSKRSGLSLDFIDSLLNDPMFADEPEEPLSSDSLLHEPSLHGESLPQEPMFNEAHNQESMFNNVLAPEKDPMSNVIPGAEDPYHSKSVTKPTEHQQQVADHLMDDFLYFLDLKAMGLLDQCLGFKRR